MIMEQIRQRTTINSAQPVATGPVFNGIPSETVEQTSITSRRTQAEVVNGVVWFIFGVLEILLGLRILFLLLGARASGFAAFLYTLTAPFVAPFRGIFAAPAAGSAYFDSAAVLAMIIYALLAWGIAALVDLLLTPKTTTNL
jgi:hypothetical protein